MLLFEETDCLYALERVGDYIRDRHSEMAADNRAAINCAGLIMTLLRRFEIKLQKCRIDANSTDLPRALYGAGQLQEFVKGHTSDISSLTEAGVFLAALYADLQQLRRLEPDLNRSGLHLVE